MKQNIVLGMLTLTSFALVGVSDPNTIAQRIFGTDLEKLKTEEDYNKYKQESLNALPKDFQRTIIDHGIPYLISDRTVKSILHIDGIFSPDGTRIASGSKLLDLLNRKPNIELPILATLKGTIVSFSPDGTKIVTRSGDNIILLWENKPSSNPQSLATFQSGRAVQNIAISPDSKIMATGSMNDAKHGIAQLWSIAPIHNFQPLATFEHGSYNNARIVFNPDGTIVATTANDNHVKLWKNEPSENPQPIATLSHQGKVSNAVFSPDGKRIATVSSSGGTTGGGSGTVTLWNIASNQKPQIIAALLHYGPTGSLTFSHDGKRILTGSTDKQATLWNNEPSPNAQPIAIFEDQYAVGSVAFSPDDKIIATGSNKSMKLWKNEPSESPQPFFSSHAATTKILFSPDGMIISAGSGLWLLPNISKLDLASAQIVAYALQNKITTPASLPAYLKPDLNDYGTELLFGTGLPADWRTSTNPKPPRKK